MSKTATKPSPKPDAPVPFVRLGETPPDPRQVVLVPGHEIPLIALDLPKTLRGQAREQVARRQLADRMGLRSDEIDMRPFVPGGSSGKPSDLWTRVLITGQGHAAGWKGLNCRAVLPDYLSLPTAGGVWTVASEMLDGAESVMVRLGPDDGFSATPEIAAALLTRALANTPPPTAILRQGPAVAGIEAVASAHDIAVVDTEAALAQQGGPVPGVLTHGELACDLRNDPMAARARLARRVLPWRWPLLAGTIAAALWGAAHMLAIDRIEDRTTQITSQTQALVETHFVTSGPVLDIRVQVSRILADMRTAIDTTDTDGDPLMLAGRAAEVLAAERADPESISYRTGDGLLLVLRLTDFAAAERVTARLRDAGLAAQLEESRVSDSRSGVRTEIRITSAEARQ